MEKNPTTEAIAPKDTFNWQMDEYEDYIAGYKLYKKLKEKWDVIGKGETSDVYH